MDGGAEPVEDVAVAKALQATSTRIHLTALLNAALVTVLFWAVASYL